MSVVIAYVGSRLVFTAFDFKYNLFVEPFNTGKLAADLAVFACFYLIGYWFLGRLRFFKK
jgi:hypothetical protein